VSAHSRDHRSAVYVSDRDQWSRLSGGNWVDFTQFGYLPYYTARAN